MLLQYIEIHGNWFMHSSGPAVTFQSGLDFGRWFFSFSSILLSLSCCVTQFGTSCSCWTNEPKILCRGVHGLVIDWKVPRSCGSKTGVPPHYMWQVSILTPTPLIPMEAIRVYFIIQGLTLHRILSSLFTLFHYDLVFKLVSPFPGFRLVNVLTISQKSSQ